MAERSPISFGILSRFVESSYPKIKTEKMVPHVEVGEELQWILFAKCSHCGPIQLSFLINDTVRQITAKVSKEFQRHNTCDIKIAPVKESNIRRKIRLE